MSPPKIIRQAFAYAQDRLDCPLEGECLSASVLMHKFLRHRGVPVQLRRYESEDYGGHWTVVTPYGEFDPTIGYWPEAEEWGYSAGLVRVGAAPYREWIVDDAVDEATAYEVAMITP